MNRRSITESGDLDSKVFKSVKFIYLAVLLTVSIFVTAGISIIIKYVLPDLKGMMVFSISIDLFGMIIGELMLLSFIRESKSTKENRALIRLIAIISFTLFWDMLSWAYDGMKDCDFIVKLSNTMLFVNGNVMAFTFFAYVEASLLPVGNETFKKTKLVCAVLSVVGIISDILNWFLGFYFTVDADAVYHRSGLFSVCYLTTALILLLAAIKIFSRKISLLDKLTYFTYIIFPLIAILFQSLFYGVSLMYPAMLLSAMLIYNNIYIASGKKLLEQEAIMTKQSTALMISQIQPHFLYNTLTTISNLCTTNPQEAEECTVMFSRYLRTNLDSLRRMDPVPFESELDHIEVYLELEKKRFKDKLNVEFIIGDTQFLVPALGIQPIVENSVKHGIRGKDEPGHLIIRCDAIASGHRLIIEDDGIGFDPYAPPPNDGRSHVGMQNVRERLKRMVNAEMEIESSPGNGCKTTIFFPKQ